jgi:hypothetical protein
MTPHQFVAVALWIAHTFVYQRFAVTPRLMMTSPVRGCGKTTLLDLHIEEAARLRDTMAAKPGPSRHLRRSRWPRSARCRCRSCTARS